MYEQYLRDPASVGEEWRNLFDNGKLAELPVIPTSREEALSGSEMRDAGRVPATTPTPPASRAYADRRSRRAPRPEHDGLVVRPDGHLVPRHRGRDARRAPQGAERSARRPGEEGLVHAPDRLRDRPGGEAAARHDTRVPGSGREAAPPRPAGGAPGPRRGRGEEGRQSRPGGSRHQARRADGLRRVPRDL